MGSLRTRTFRRLLHRSDRGSMVVSLLNYRASKLPINFNMGRYILIFSCVQRQRSYGVMVSTQDSESCDPSSSLGRTLFFLTTYHPLNFTTMGEICHVMITNQNAHYNEDDNGLYLGRRSRSRRTQ